MSAEPTSTAPPTAPQSRTTLTPSKPAPAATLTPAQTVADNLSTRLQGIVAIAAYIVLARWGLLPGTWAAGLIAATVLPVEVTRHIAKSLVGQAAARAGIATSLLGVFVAMHKLLTFGAFGAVTVAYLASCSASPVHTQAIATSVTADGFNTARGIVLDRYEAKGRAMVLAACCDRAAMEAAADLNDQHFLPVLASWEAARAAHDRLRERLMQCQADGDTRCDVDLATLRGEFEAAATGARCAYVALGEADPLGVLGPLTCASSSPPPDSPPTDAGPPVPSRPVNVPRPTIRDGGVL
jgi:hypothetical protein